MKLCSLVSLAVAFTIALVVPVSATMTLTANPTSVNIYSDYGQNIMIWLAPMSSSPYSKVSFNYTLAGPIQFAKFEQLCWPGNDQVAASPGHIEVTPQAPSTGGINKQWVLYLHYSGTGQAHLSLSGLEVLDTSGSKIPDAAIVNSEIDINIQPAPPTFTETFSGEVNVLGCNCACLFVESPDRTKSFRVYRESLPYSAIGSTISRLKINGTIDNNYPDKILDPNLAHTVEVIPSNESPARLGMSFQSIFGEFNLNPYTANPLPSPCGRLTTTYGTILKVRDIYFDQEDIFLTDGQRKIRVMDCPGAERAHDGDRAVMTGILFYSHDIQSGINVPAIYDPGTYVTSIAGSKVGTATIPYRGDFRVISP